MTAPGKADPLDLILAARKGQRDALGALLDLYRNYVSLLARTQIDSGLAARVSPSDVVQETMFEACRDFAQFRGQSEGEFIGWLRGILVSTLARLIEHHIKTQKRTIGREVSIDDCRREVDRSAMRLENAFAGAWSSPSAQASRRERAAILADQLTGLPPDYREVIVLRNLEGLSFEEVACRMGRTAGAVRVLWVRAVERLRNELVEQDLL